jgi:hypothetical protein
MKQFDEQKVQIEPVYGSRGDATVRYAGRYAGCVKKIREGEYSCAVSMERDGQRILQAFGRSDSIESGARDVAYQWFLIHRDYSTQA